MAAVLAAASPLAFALGALAAPDTMEASRDALRRHDYARAAGLLEPLAQAGNAEAAYQLAQLLRSGQGVPANPAAACRWLLQSATAGYARAAYSLGARA